MKYTINRERTPIKNIQLTISPAEFAILMKGLWHLAPAEVRNDLFSYKFPTSIFGDQETSFLELENDIISIYKEFV